MPTAHAPSADRLKPTVECIAMVAPRYLGSAAIDMPDVNAPESAGTVMAYTRINGSSSHGDLSANTPIRSATAAEAEHHRRDGAVAAEPEREFIAKNAGGHGEHGEHTLTTIGVRIDASEFLKETKVQNATIHVLMP